MQKGVRVMRFESLHQESESKPMVKVWLKKQPLLIADTNSPAYKAAYAKTKQQLKDGTL